MQFSFSEAAQVYIPIINRVRGPHGKLRTEIFSSLIYNYGPSAKHAIRREYNWDPYLQYGPRRQG